ncbi:uncharacterized protein TRAVEDRAFT_54513 [Trametes versicolor FP-101664 SS1]|uniref:Uncharacterized protein n=1 Tax=Trametes versicolor (strain FP-101664) TaxID=717944 RepID=R7S6C9_TRAVS|nr:uncharacterized protein TRAVEDRAFT_54513 [Trametes versicolor FP-101664 SS1]EIW51473.1 hypothetical protein TRAVEDRAFT_54513 [Trametes versicolor FP-101664 SS1]
MPPQHLVVALVSAPLHIHSSQFSMMANLQDKQTIYEYPEFQQFVDAILANQPWRKDDNEDELMRWLLGMKMTIYSGTHVCDADCVCDTQFNMFFQHMEDISMLDGIAGKFILEYTMVTRQRKIVAFKNAVAHCKVALKVETDRTIASFKIGMGERDNALVNCIAAHKHSVQDVAAAGIKLGRAEQSLHDAESEYSRLMKLQSFRPWAGQVRAAEWGAKIAAIGKPWVEIPVGK